MSFVNCYSSIYFQFPHFFKNILDPPKPVHLFSQTINQVLISPLFTSQSIETSSHAQRLSFLAMEEADQVIQPEEPSNGTPLLNPDQTHEQEDTLLDESLKKLETFLCFFGFHQSSFLSFFLSWAAFAVVGVLVPVLILVLSGCSSCEKYQITRFELDILVSQTCLAAVSLLCISHNLRKHGIRRFLFVDRYHGHMVRFHKEYVKKLQGFFYLLAVWISPCLFLKTVREVVRIIYFHDSWWQSVAILLGLILSWVYVTMISLSACVLFNLVCSLQVIHFEDYGKLLESEKDISMFMEEHMRLRHYLSKISHRFRIYLVLELVVVTASQFMTLFQTTGNHGIISFINGGDFVVTSIVQVVGIVLCLHAAAKISHRAQGIASVASRWHAMVTCSTGAPQLSVSNSMGNINNPNLVGSLSINYSESDLESLDNLVLPNTRLASCMTFYHKRQAFVMYLQSNPGGVTIFGWTVDRALINTIFFLELSLVLFVLGKTIVLTSK